MFLKTSNAPSSSSAVDAARNTSNHADDPPFFTVSICVMTFCHECRQIRKIHTDHSRIHRCYLRSPGEDMRKMCLNIEFFVQTLCSNKDLKPHFPHVPNICLNKEFYV